MSAAAVEGTIATGTGTVTAPETEGAPSRGRSGGRSIDPITLLRWTSGTALVLVAEWQARFGAHPALRGPLLGLALLLLPLDLLPALVMLFIRVGDPVAGVLLPADVIALVYLARVALHPTALGLRLTPSRIVLALFLLWAVLATMAGVGILTALGRIALYAALGMAVTHHPRAKKYVLWGAVAWALTSVVLYLPEFPSRLWGFYIDDPAQAGGLFIAALLVVLASKLPTAWKVLLGGLIAFGIVATFTRSIWFAFCVVLVAAVLPRRWYVPLLLPPALGVLSIPFVPQITELFALNSQSGLIRMNSLMVGLREFWDRPIAGHGWAFSSFLTETEGVGLSSTPLYSMWIYIAASVGIVGVILFAAFLALVAREVLNDTVAYFFLIAILATALSEMPFFGSCLNGLLFFLLTSVYSERTSETGPATPERMSAERC
ncbi:hypothetical protein GCM10022226_17810 [Sphaerisporangium flaviroseum]|uniref:O-antigen ligase domain-containing protein n=1 Tax=Sphaerisporangium flaviroseum TaxID=509199 RepID=A0ABP7HQD0_9ACTN